MHVQSSNLQNWVRVQDRYKTHSADRPGQARHSHMVAEKSGQRFFFSY